MLIKKAINYNNNLKYNKEIVTPILINIKIYLNYLVLSTNNFSSSQKWIPSIISKYLLI